MGPTRISERIIRSEVSAKDRVNATRVQGYWCGERLETRPALEGARGARKVEIRAGHLVPLGATPTVNGNRQVTIETGCAVVGRAYSGDLNSGSADLENIRDFETA